MRGPGNDVKTTQTLVTVSSADREIEGPSEFTYFRGNSDDEIAVDPRDDLLA